MARPRKGWFQRRCRGVRGECRDRAAWPRIALAFESFLGRRNEQFAGLRIAKCRRRAFIVVGRWPLDAVDRIAEDGIAFAQIIEQRGQSRKLPPDAGVGQLAGFEILAPGDHVSARDRPQLGGTFQTGEGGKFGNIVVGVASPALPTGRLASRRKPYSSTPARPSHALRRS